MQYTQVELTNEGDTEVWWLPIPVGRAHVNEKITRKGFDEDWVITSVGITLPEEALPPKARVARSFRRSSETISFMSI